jgi:methionyl-tRNA formyltransferase
MKPSIIFFGSFGHYSAIVLKELIESNLLTISHVVTTPPFVNRKGKEEKGAVQIEAEEHNIPFTTQMPSLFSNINENFEADFIITAGYGKLLPGKLLNEPKIASLNLHFSLLPKYRGANPGEWAILMNEKETGISIIEMNEKFDEGGTIFSLPTPITDEDNRETIYEKLYSSGGKSLGQVIVDFSTGKLKTTKQPETDLPYASRLKRDDGFISWEDISKTMNGETASLESLSKTMTKIVKLQELDNIDAHFISRASRALYGFPSLWTKIPTAKGEKRMKIHTTEVIDNKLVLNEVQIEGQARAKWNQVKNILK